MLGLPAVQVTPPTAAGRAVGILPTGPRSAQPFAGPTALGPRLFFRTTVAKLESTGAR